MGFIHDIKRILKLLPSGRQNLLFSATFSDEIKALADGLLNKPTLVEVARRNTTAENVSQTICRVNMKQKRELLSYLIDSRNWQQVLVFTRTKHGANRLATQLEKDGIKSAAIHGNKSQGARTKALADFKAGSVRVLVATDIAARGLDIDQLPHVVNYELPNVPEDYVHRIGRTGRAGFAGEAISLVSDEEIKLLKAIERVLRKPLTVTVVEGFEPQPNSQNETTQNAHQPGSHEKRWAGHRKGTSTQRTRRSKTSDKSDPATPRQRQNKAKIVLHRPVENQMAATKL